MYGGGYYRRFSGNGFAVGSRTGYPLPGPELSVFYNSTNLLSAALAGKCLFDALFLTRLQVEGVLFNFFYDVFLLDLPLETP